ncbi:unnamed protein product [Allacma fusca]|uniref:Uncharacterized protein n=1 Tax=Allacma fusca TaxID=39272 RepID=A0A8J2JGI5_9HEXA|nr:unnamed protein product [Allacma fusca]
MAVSASLIGLLYSALIYQISGQNYSSYNENDVLVATQDFIPSNVTYPPHNNSAEGFQPPSDIVHGFKPVYSTDAQFVSITTDTPPVRKRKPILGIFKKNRRPPHPPLPTTAPQQTAPSSSGEQISSELDQNKFVSQLALPVQNPQVPSQNPFTRIANLFRQRPQQRPNPNPPYAPPSGNFQQHQIPTPLPQIQPQGVASHPTLYPPQQVQQMQLQAQPSQQQSFYANSNQLGYHPRPHPNQQLLSLNLNNYLKRISTMFSRAPHPPGGGLRPLPHQQPQMNPMYPHYFPLNTFAPTSSPKPSITRRRRIKVKKNQTRRNDEVQYLTGRPRNSKPEETDDKPDSIQVKLTTGFKTESSQRGFSVSDVTKRLFNSLEPVFFRMKRSTAGYRMPGIFGMDGGAFYLDKDPNTGDITFSPPNKSVATSSNEVTDNSTETTTGGMKKKKPMPIIIHSYSTTKLQGQNRRPLINQKFNNKRPTFYKGNRTTTLAPPRLPSFYPKFPQPDFLKPTTTVSTTVSTTTSTTTSEATTTTATPTFTTTTTPTTTSTTTPTTTPTTTTTQEITESTSTFDPYLPFEMINWQRTSTTGGTSDATNLITTSTASSAIDQAPAHISPDLMHDHINSPTGFIPINIQHNEEFGLRDSSDNPLMPPLLEIPAGQQTIPHSISQDIKVGSLEVTSSLLPSSQEVRPSQKLTPGSQEINVPLELSPGQINERLPVEFRPSSQEVRPFSQEVRPGSQEVRRGSQEVRPGSQEVRPGSQEVRPGSQEVRPGSQEVRPGSQEVRPGSQEVKVASVELRPGSVELGSISQELKPGKIEPASPEQIPILQERRPTSPGPKLGSQELINRPTSPELGPSSQEIRPVSGSLENGVDKVRVPGSVTEQPLTTDENATESEYYDYEEPVPSTPEQQRPPFYPPYYGQPPPQQPGPPNSFGNNYGGFNPYYNYPGYYPGPQGVPTPYYPQPQHPFYPQQHGFNPHQPGQFPPPPGMMNFQPNQNPQQPFNTQQPPTDPSQSMNPSMSPQPSSKVPPVPITIPNVIPPKPTNVPLTPPQIPPQSINNTQQSSNALLPSNNNVSQFSSPSTNNFQQPSAIQPIPDVLGSSNSSPSPSAEYPPMTPDKLFPSPQPSDLSTPPSQSPDIPNRASPIIPGDILAPLKPQDILEDIQDFKPIPTEFESSDDPSKSESEEFSVEQPVGPPMAPVQLPPNNFRQPPPHFRPPPPHHFRPPPHHFQFNRPRVPPPPYHNNRPINGFPIRTLPPMSEILRTTTFAPTTSVSTPAAPVVDDWEVSNHQVNMDYNPWMESSDGTNSKEKPTTQQAVVVTTPLTTASTTVATTTTASTTTTPTTTPTTAATTTTTTVPTTVTTTTTTTTTPATTTTTTTAPTTTTTTSTTTTTTPTSRVQTTDVLDQEDLMKEEEYEDYPYDYPNGPIDDYQSRNPSIEQRPEQSKVPNVDPSHNQLKEPFAPSQPDVTLSSPSEQVYVQHTPPTTRPTTQSPPTTTTTTPSPSLPNILPQFRPNANILPEDRLPLFGEKDKKTEPKDGQQKEVPNGPVMIPPLEEYEYIEEDEPVDTNIGGMLPPPPPQQQQPQKPPSRPGLFNLSNLPFFRKPAHFNNTMPPGFFGPPPSGFYNNNSMGHFVPGPYGHHHHMQGPPGHMQGQPGHMQGQPGHMQGQPGHMQGQPGHMQGQPGHMQGQPGHMQGQPGHMQGPPGHMQGQPGHMQGPPGHMQGQPGHMQGQPGHMQGQPGHMQGPPPPNQAMTVPLGHLPPGAIPHPLPGHPGQSQQLRSGHLQPPNNQLQQNSPQNPGMQSIPIPMHLRPLAGDQKISNGQPPTQLGKIPQNAQYPPSSQPQPHHPHPHENFQQTQPISVPQGQMVGPSPSQGPNANLPQIHLPGQHYQGFLPAVPEPENNLIRRNGIHIPPPNFRPMPNSSPLNYAGISPPTNLPFQPQPANSPPSQQSSQNELSKPIPINRSSSTSSEEVIYVTQEELEKLKAEGHDDEFVVYSEEQDGNKAAPPPPKSPPTSPPQPMTPIPVKPFEGMATQQPFAPKITPLAPSAFASKIEYDTSVELITGNPIEFIDESKPRDIVVKTSFSHGGGPLMSAPTISRTPNPSPGSASGWRAAVEAVPLEDSIKFVIPKELKKPTVDYGGFHPLSKH